jgi:hypothetical protein
LGLSLFRHFGIDYGRRLRDSSKLCESIAIRPRRQGTDGPASAQR